MQFPLACIFADLANQGHLAVQLYTMPLSMQTLLAIPIVLLSPPTQLTLNSSSPHPRRQWLFTNFLFYSLLLLNSNERLMEALSVLYFWDHHTPIQSVAKPTEALDTALVYIISKLCAEARGLNKPRIITTNSLHLR